MTNFSTLEVLLHGEIIGTISNLYGDKNLFAFTEEYIHNYDRSTLSLSFKDSDGSFKEASQITRTRLSPFFANLLPEGHLRNYLASQGKIKPEREFYLLALLGKDLPGGLEVRPTVNTIPFSSQDEALERLALIDHEEAVLRFSLAGVQLKFSAIEEKENSLTIPVNGVGGAWIVKLPSSGYPRVPENEYSMLEIARKIGVNVPQTGLIPLENIHGLPKGIEAFGETAFVTKRFDRDVNGKGVHIEDFAQVFAVFPEKKYSAASYRNIAQILSAEVGDEGLIEFIRRFIFNALIGNGDMHLKNWSLIYPDKKKPVLAPAYDFVSTIPYLPEDSLALSFVDSKKFSSLTVEQLKRFAVKTKISEMLVLQIAEETIKRFRNVWKDLRDLNLPLDDKTISIINAHLNTIPLFKI